MELCQIIHNCCIDRELIEKIIGCKLNVGKDKNQRKECGCVAVIISDFIYFWITKRVVSADSEIAILVVAFAGGVGCSLACFINEKLSKDRIYVNVIMSDNLEEMKHFRDFLAKHHSVSGVFSIRLQ